VGPTLIGKWAENQLKGTQKSINIGFSPLIDPTSPIAPQNNIFHTKLSGNQVSDQIWFMYEGP